MTVLLHALLALSLWGMAHRPLPAVLPREDLCAYAEATRWSPAPWF